MNAAIVCTVFVTNKRSLYKQQHCNLGKRTENMDLCEDFPDMPMLCDILASLKDISVFADKGENLTLHGGSIQRGLH